MLVETRKRISLMTSVEGLFRTFPGRLP